jgi:hypothetical protein
MRHIIHTCIARDAPAAVVQAMRRTQAGPSVQAWVDGAEYLSRSGCHAQCMQLLRSVATWTPSSVRAILQLDVLPPALRGAHTPVAFASALRPRIPWGTAPHASRRVRLR